MLRTVRVPPGMESVFAVAEEAVSRYFRERRDDPEHGTIEIFGERYVLVRAASLSVGFFGLVEQLFGPGREPEADEFARNILFDLAHAVGKSDAANFHARMGLTDPIARMSAGPVHFAHAGWAFVDISPESRPTPDERFYLLYDHPYAFESDAWLRAGARRARPTCIMNAGYSSGWCEESFGVELVAAEILCRARGDETCRFVMAHPRHIEARIAEIAHPAPRVVGAIPDFFARKRVEEELREARADLEARVEERTRELGRAHERLLQAQKLEAIGTLAGGIAHDFNNLVAVAVGNAGALLARLPEGDARRPFAEEIIAAGRRAAALTRQLLAFSRSNVATYELVDPNRVTSDLARMLGRVLGEHIELAVALDPGAGAVEADRAQLEQVLMNLVVNARDAMPDGGRLEVATAAVELAAPRPTALGVLTPGPYVRVTVRDTGIGMDGATLARVFDPFFTTKGERNGSGLGLYTASGIVKRLGGGIAVASTVGEGTSFEVWLPRAAAATVPASAPVPGRGVRGSETVLVVEDEPALRAVIATILGDLGYAILVADGGEDALRVAAAHAGRIDLLLTDVVMPRMHGTELAAMLRRARPSVRVLYMSGYTEDEAFAPVAGDRPPLVAKPFEPQELARRVREVLEA